MSSADKVIKIALAEVGYREKASNAFLDDPQANAGSGNWTKYARDLAAAGYYNGSKNGYAWCECFVDWCFFKAFGPDGQRIQCQTGDLGAACIYSMQYYKQQGRCDMNPRPGDQVFFYGGGTIGHTGIVTAVSDSTVTVVEGNSSDRVQQLNYRRGDSRIAGYGHPWYERAENIIGEEKEGEPTPAPASPQTSNLPTPTASGQTVKVRLPLLKRGATGTAVESAQLLLIHRGYNCGGKKSLLGGETPDGDFGPATEKAVTAFQTTCSLESDGEIGLDTWAAMLTA